MGEKVNSMNNINNDQVNSNLKAIGLYIYSAGAKLSDI